jgi:hypothetical protein
VLLDNGVSAAFLNAGINGAIAWAVFHRTTVVPLWGQMGIAADTIATSLLLPFITCLVVTRLTAWHLRAGRLFPLGMGSPRPLVDRLPRPTLIRATALALVALVALAPLSLAALALLGVDALPFRAFLLFKIGFAVAASTLVTPFTAFLALAAPPAPRG